MNPLPDERARCGGFSAPTTALARRKTKIFDLVLADYIRPGISGIEMVGALRELPDYALVPAITIPAEHDRALRNSAIAGGGAAGLVRQGITGRLRIAAVDGDAASDFADLPWMRRAIAFLLFLMVVGAAAAAFIAFRPVRSVPPISPKTLSRA